MSTRSIAGRSDFATEVPDDEDEEVERQREIDDSYVLDYVTSQLQRVKSHDTSFDPSDVASEYEVEAQWNTNGGYNWKR